MEQGYTSAERDWAEFAKYLGTSGSVWMSAVEITTS